MSIEFSNYGQARDVDATPEELRVFELISETVPADVELVRRSDSYVTAAVGDWDLARFKFTSRAKWILFPIVERPKEKHKIEKPEDVLGFTEKLNESLSHIK